MAHQIGVGERTFIVQDDGTITDMSGKRAYSADEIWPPSIPLLPPSLPIGRAREENPAAPVELEIIPIKRPGRPKGK